MSYEICLGLGLGGLPRLGLIKRVFVTTLGLK